MKFKIGTSNEGLIACLMFCQTVISSIHLLLVQLHIPSGFMNYVSYGIAYGVSVYAILRSLKNRKTIYIYIGFVLMLLQSYFFNNDARIVFFASDGTNQIFLSNIFTLVFLYFPIFVICASSRINVRNLLDKMIPYSLLNTVIAVFSFLVNVMGNSVYSLEYMNFAYSYLVTVYLCYYAFETTKKRTFLIVAIAGSISIVLGGSRGALISLIVFWFLYIFFGSGTKKTWKRALLKITLVVFMAFFLRNFDSIIMSLSEALSNYGYSSRLIRLIEGSEGGFFHFSDRFVVQQSVVMHLGDRVFGYGLFGDRYFSGYTGYAHNWIIEFIIDYGYIIGFTLVISALGLLAIFGKKSIKGKRIEFKLLWYIMICLISIKYMFSSSYLASREMMLILGMLVSFASHYKWYVSVMNNR